MNDEITTSERKWHVDELKFTKEKKFTDKKFFINDNEVVNETLIKRIWHVLNATMWALKIKLLKEKSSYNVIIITRHVMLNH